VLPNPPVTEIRIMANGRFAYTKKVTVLGWDRLDWSITPETNDAYNGVLHDIVFSVGIRRPSMFDG
jgi:predicted metalloendopeptidase